MRRFAHPPAGRGLQPSRYVKTLGRGYKTRPAQKCLSIPHPPAPTVARHIGSSGNLPLYIPWPSIVRLWKNGRINAPNWTVTAEQVAEFHKNQLQSPRTHRQLFDLAANRLLDLKDWLECGNDSPWQTWLRVEQETEMRTLIAGWLNQHASRRYTTAEEPELANSQRMDICLQNPDVDSPVPIELKLLDKGWTGPRLCERLRNQLAGDYLREKNAQSGVMLLVAQGKKQGWIINNRLVRLDGLAAALKDYWHSIADKFPGVEAMEVIVIDLAIRGQVSDS